MAEMHVDTAVLERTAQAFRADMWRTATPDAVAEYGIEQERFGPVQVTIVGAMPATPGFNLVLGAAEPGAVEGGHLAAAIELADSYRVDYRVPVAQDRPGGGAAEDWLNQDGFLRGVSRVKFARGASAADIPEVPGVTVYEIGTEEAEGEGLSTIAEEAFQLPAGTGTLVFCLPIQDGWRCYTAALDERAGVVSCGSMLIQEGVAQLGIDATLAPARAHGCHQALLRRRLLDAAEAGCHTVFAELGDCSPRNASIVRHNLLRAGFQTVHRSQDWRRPSGS